MPLLPTLGSKPRILFVFIFCFIYVGYFQVICLLFMAMAAVNLTVAHFTSLPYRLVASSSSWLIGLGSAYWLAPT